jgi:hypothetical protein
MVKILVVSIRHPTKTVFGKCITTYPQRVSRNGTEAFIYVNKASSMLLQRFSIKEEKGIYTTLNGVVRSEYDFNE